MLLTTSPSFDGYRIKRYIAVLSGESVIGTGFFSDLGATVSDFLGTESDAMIQKLNKARNYAFERLVQKAEAAGANAIIGIEFDSSVLAANVLSIIVNGTAVEVEEIQKKEIECISSQTVPVCNYSTGIPVRFTWAVVQRIGEFCRLSLDWKNYSEQKYEGFKVQLEAVDIFGDRSALGCYAIYMRDGKVSDIPLPWQALEGMAGIDVQLLAARTASGVTRFQAVYQSVDCVGLDDLKHRYGNDAVVTFSSTPDSWQCVCGQQNYGCDRCSFCGRSFDGAASAGIQAIAQKAVQAKTCREILALLEQSDDIPDTPAFSDLLEECRRMARSERMYGADSKAAARIAAQLVDLAK